MFVISRDVSAAKKVIATLLATALVMYGLGYATYAEAATLQNVSDLMSDTSPNADSDHTITFNLVNDLLNGQTVVVNFDTANGFDFTGVAATDFSITAGGGTFSEAISVPTDTITFTSTGSTVASGTLVTIAINGTNKPNNPTPLNGDQSFEIDVTAGADTGHTRVVILETVLVTASVLTTFDFTVIGQPAGVPVNGTTSDIVTTSTTIPFGVLSAGVPKTGAQDLTVSTNARNGFVVTVESDGAFRSSTGADIDSFSNGTDLAVPTAWASPTNNISQENTWGHWGVTTEDTDAADAIYTGDEFASNEFISVSTTPRAVFAHNAPSDGVTPNIGSTTVGYQVQITPLQEAGDDYQTTLTYIATPTF